MRSNIKWRLHQFEPTSVISCCTETESPLSVMWWDRPFSNFMNAGCFSASAPDIFSGNNSITAMNVQTILMHRKASILDVPIYDVYHRLLCAIYFITITRVTILIISLQNCIVDRCRLVLMQAYKFCPSDTSRVGGSKLLHVHVYMILFGFSRLFAF